MAGGGAIRAGKAFVELFVDASKADADLASFKGKMAKWGQSIGSAFSQVQSVIGPIVQEIADAVNLFSEHGSKLADFGNETGVAASALSELEHAASQTGTSMEDIARGMVKMNKTIGDAKGGSKQAADALAALGLSVEDLKGLKPDEQFAKIADRLSKIEDPAERTSKAMDIFGKSATKMNGLISEGADGIERLRKEAKDLKLGWTQEDIRIADELGDKMATFEALTKRTQELIGSKFGPELIRTYEKLNSLIVLINSNMDKIIPLIEKVWWLNKQVSGFGALDLVPDQKVPDIKAPDAAKPIDVVAEAVADAVAEEVAKMPAEFRGHNPFAEQDARKNWLGVKADPFPASADPFGIRKVKDAVDQMAMGTFGSFNAFEAQQQAWGGQNPVVDAIKQLKDEAKKNADRIEQAIKQGKDFGWAP